MGDFSDERSDYESLTSYSEQFEIVEDDEYAPYEGEWEIEGETFLGHLEEERETSAADDEDLLCDLPEKEKCQSDCGCELEETQGETKRKKGNAQVTLFKKKCTCVHNKLWLKYWRTKPKVKCNCPCTDPLAPLNKDNFEEVLTCLQLQMPISIMAYSFMKTGLFWKKMMPEKDYSVHILVVKDCYCALILYTLIQGELRGTMFSASQRGRLLLAHAQSQSKLFQFNSAVYEWMIPWDLSQTFSRIHFSKSDKADEYVTYLLFWLPRETASVLQNESSLKLQSLRPRHAAQINRKWEFRSPTSEEHLRTVLEHNLSVGLFNFEKRLVAWALQSHHGGISIVDVESDYKGKDCEREVVIALAHKLIAKGFEPFTLVRQEDVVLERFYENIGFIFIEKYAMFSSL